MAYKDLAKANAYKKKWREANPEKVAEAEKRHRERNRDKINARGRASYAANSEKKRAYHREWSRRNRAYEEARRRKATRELREAIRIAYGNSCACCGETNHEFLTIDHINGDGSIEKRAGRAGLQLYRWLRNNGFPKDRYRLLCMNCNWARGKFGYCPHERVLTQENPCG